MVRFTKLILFIVSLFVLTGCFNDDTVTVRFRAIVVLEVDGEEREFSNVMQFKYTKLEPGNVRQARSDIKMWGEAIIVDLDKRGKAYILPILYTEQQKFGTSTYFTDNLLRTLRDGKRLRDLKQTQLELLREFEGRKKLLVRGDYRPTFVYFKDETKPKSLHYLDAASLDVYFGQGVKFISAEIERTDANFTNGELAKHLPWINKPANLIFSGRLPYDQWKFKLGLGKGSFFLPESLKL